VSTPDLEDLTRRLRCTLPDGTIRAQALPGCDDLRLALIAPDFPRGPLPREVMQAVLRAPAYWGFCWASGLALARRLLAEPELVAGRVVADVGSGSGVAGIAAARAGAARVVACDIDPDALAATRANAALNGVALDTCATLEALAERAPAPDLVLLADVLYDAANRALLDAVAAGGAEILVADARVKTVDAPGFVPDGDARAETLPNLDEFDEFRHVRFYRRAARPEAPARTGRSA
jgi:predicted nicotinamide N-methyase